MNDSINTMTRLFASFCALLLTTGLGAQTRQLFDFGWQFTHNGKAINVDLPHDWDIYTKPYSGKGATGTGGGWYEAGKGEYRKTFKTPDSEVVKLHFEGVYQKAEVYVNGQRAGQHHYGYTPFTVDVTPFLKLKNSEIEKRTQRGCRQGGQQRSTQLSLVLWLWHLPSRMARNDARPAYRRERCFRDYP